MAISILVADDQELAASGIRTLLEAHPGAGFSVVGLACSGAQVVEMAKRLRPDVVLMEARTPAMDGVAAAAGLDRQALSMAMFATRPGGTIVLLTRDEEAPARPQAKNELRDLRLGDLLRLHEKRDWSLPPREIAHKVKSVRVEFYRRRLIERGMDLIVAGGRLSEATLTEYNASHAATLSEVVRECAARYGTRARVVVLPEADTTLPITEYTGIAS